MYTSELQTHRRSNRAMVEGCTPHRLSLSADTVSSKQGTMSPSRRNASVQTFKLGMLGGQSEGPFKFAGMIDGLEVRPAARPCIHCW